MEAGVGTVGPVDYYGAQGSIDFPLSDSFGAQVDGFVGQLKSITGYGGAGHVFWRDPSTALVGLYVSDQHFDLFGGFDVTKVGGEAELYLNAQWTLRAIAGWESADFLPDRFFDRADVVYYPSDNFSIMAGHRYTLGVHAAVLGAQFQLPGTNFAVSLQGRAGELHTSGIFGSLTYFFGETGKPLSARARQDDPVNSLSDDVAAAAQQSSVKCGVATVTKVACTAVSGANAR